MSDLGVTDHALLRFLERAGGLDIEELRARLAASLDRAHVAARKVTTSDYLIRADGLLYVVRDEAVTTVLDDVDPMRTARALGRSARSRQRPPRAIEGQRD